MVMNASFVTMGRWNIATAKAELSRVLRDAQQEPQVIENRGSPVAVVLGASEYERVQERERAAGSWEAALAASAAVRAAGGAPLRLPTRVPRKSPFSRG
jgi:prevent-host-death family protein